MSRLARRPLVDHRETAARLRAEPGTWLPVGEYRHGSGAQGMAGFIRNASGSSGGWYQPAGSFETRTELTENGVRLEARYVGTAAGCTARGSETGGVRE